MLIFNINYGISLGAYHKYAMDQLDADLRDGAPNFMLSGRYAPALATSTEVVHDKLATLRRAGLGRFALLRTDPSFREVPLPAASATLHQMTLEGETAVGVGSEPSLVFTLPATTFVCGIRSRYSYSIRGDDGPVPFQVSWKRDDQRSFIEARSRLSYLYRDRAPEQRNGPPEEDVTVWIGDFLKQIRIRPDLERAAGPGVFRIREVTLLVPVDEQFSVPAVVEDWYGETLLSPRAAVFNEAYVRPVRYRETLKVFLGDLICGIPSGQKQKASRRRSPAITSLLTGPRP
jgi:hypothetical protein